MKVPSPLPFVRTRAPGRRSACGGFSRYAWNFRTPRQGGELTRDPGIRKQQRYAPQGRGGSLPAPMSRLHSFLGRGRQGARDTSRGSGQVVGLPLLGSPSGVPALDASYTTRERADAPRPDDGLGASSTTVRRELRSGYSMMPSPRRSSVDSSVMPPRPRWSCSYLNSGNCTICSRVPS